MSFGQGEPRVYLLNIETGQREIVGNFPGMTFAPRFSPDGQRVIMSLQQGSNSNLFAMDLRSRADHAADADRPRSTPRRPIRRTARASVSNPIAAARSRSTSWARAAARRSASASAKAPIRRRSGRRAATIIAFTKQGGGRFGIGIMQAGRFRRAPPDRGLPQRRPDLRAERPRADVLPRSGGSGPVALFGRHHRPQRAAGSDAELRVRSGLVAALVVIQIPPHGYGVYGALTIRKRFRRHAGFSGISQDPIKVDGTFA